MSRIFQLSDEWAGLIPPASPSQQGSLLTRPPAPEGAGARGSDTPGGETSALSDGLTEHMRTERLARVNALLQASASMLGVLDDVNLYVSELLQVAMDFLGAGSGSYWLTQDEQMTQVLGPGHPPPPLDAPSHNSFFYADAEGRPWMLALPLIVAGDLLGALVLQFTTEPKLGPEDREVARAFANHAAIALFMSRAVRLARETALAEEREAAALRRLELANRLASARREALQRLAENPQGDAYLGHVLSVAIDQLGAQAGAVWLLEPDCARRILAIEGGEIRTDQADWEPPAEHLPKPPADITVYAGKDLAQLPAPYYERFLREGALSAVTIPMVFGHEMRGYIALRLPHDHGLSDEECELARSLANQAVLALEMTRLGEKARAGAVTAERNRLAREIHDTLAQGFAAIRLQLGLALGDMPATGAAVDAVRLAERIAAENLVEARRSVAILRSPTPSLKDGLSGVVDGVRRLGARNLDLTIEPTLSPPPEVAHALMRIAQEALMNAVNHAEATRIGVRLASPSDGLLRLSIVDNGRGFAPEAASSGFGLAGMRERAMIVGADFTLVSEPGAGTEVIVTWLVPDSEP
jgi:signal transduction histidine kinase